MLFVVVVVVVAVVLLQFCAASGAGKLVGLFPGGFGAGEVLGGGLFGGEVVVVSWGFWGRVGGLLGRRTGEGGGGGELGDEAEEVVVVLSMWALTGAAIEEEGRRL